VGTPDGYLTAFSPILMTLVLTRLSGVAIMEPHLRTTKPGYKEYIASTSAFFPWFPAK
jgi:steroid 5-alpha reductase family enzyme